MAEANKKTQAESKNTTPSEKIESGGSTSPSAQLEANRAKRAADMSIAGKADQKKADKESKRKTPVFEVNTKEREKLMAMSDEKLLSAAKDKMRAIDATNMTLFEPTGNTQDHSNGQDVSRSSVRSEVLAFLNSRPNKQAPANVIVAYMILASGVAYKGKFNYGYLTTKDGAEGKRGMVGRRLIREIAVEAAKESTEA